MTITPEGSTEAVESNGIGLLPEEANGSGNIENGNSPKALGTITDNNNSTNEAIYEIATGDDATADNANFNIEDNTLYYIGADSGDFETAGVKKSFTITIVRYNNEAKQSPQIFEYIVNLKNLNDNKPTDLVGYKGESTTAIDTYKAAGNVGGGEYAFVFNNGLAKDDTITITFKRGSANNFFKIEAEYTTPGDSSTFTGFILTTNVAGWTGIVTALTDTDNSDGFRDLATQQAIDDFALWDSYGVSVTNINLREGSPNPNSILFTADPVTLTARPTIEVNEGTDGIIANFASTDADNLQSLTYSLAGTDSDDFTIDATTGKLSFKTTPNFASPIDANTDNFYEVTIKVSDGLPANDKTYDLLVQVIEVTE